MTSGLSENISKYRISSVTPIRENSTMTILALFECWRRLIAEYKKNIFMVIFTAGFVTYLFLGAVLFIVVESSQESVALKNIVDVKSKVMQKYPAVPGEAIDDVLHGLSSAGVKGIVLNNSTVKWTLGNAVLFAATLLTTVGYGHLSPSTAGGKILCMTYTSIGIPLTLMLLATYVDRLMYVAELFKATLFRRIGKYYEPRVIRTIHISTIMLFIVSGCFVVPAWIFTAFEVSWSFLDALYFCFISLTTVGLGDFVPGLESTHPHVDLYRFGATLYVVCGVTIMMFMMALTADFVRHFDNPYQTILPIVITKENSPTVNTTAIPSYGTITVHQTKLPAMDKKMNTKP